MAGARSAHNRLCVNPAVVLGTQLDGSPCEGYTSDQRMQVLNASSYLYPGFVGGDAATRNSILLNLLNPTLIVEVRSASTTGAGRDEKLRLYRQLPSLRQYLMLDPQSIHIEFYTRQYDDH